MESRHRKPPRQRKDRLIQTRVGEELESTLKEEAARRRLSVSHLIRNLLEDSFTLVDNVVENVDGLVQGSIDLAGQVRRDAQRIATRAKEAAAAAEEKAKAAAGAKVDGSSAPDESAPEQSSKDGKSAEEPAATTDAPDTPVATEATDLTSVLAWNEVTLNRAASCANCGDELKRGTSAHMGIGGSGDGPPPWLCGGCLAELGEDA
jgi:hypothetical protein